jgi:hypothetical protein
MAWDGIRAAKSVYEAALLARANVVGVGVGRKIVGGRETDEPCIVVFVERKIPATDLRRRDLVPGELEGIRTDVVESGRFVALSMAETTLVERTARMRPAPGGVSIGHVRITAGTLGVLARRVRGGPVILSNNHVLANANRAARGDPILQPGPADGGRLEDTIAKLADFVPIRFIDPEPRGFSALVERGFGSILRRFGLGLRRLPAKASNVIDAAIAEPVGEGLISPSILGIGPVDGTAPPAIGLRVRKSGRTTGFTRGKITAIDASLEVDYVGRSAMFRRQLVGDIASRGGDSGSLILDESNQAVGLLFAGGLNTTVFNPIDAVLEALDITL